MFLWVKPSNGVSKLDVKQTPLSLSEIIYYSLSEIMGKDLVVLGRM